MKTLILAITIVVVGVFTTLQTKSKTMTSPAVTSAPQATTALKGENIEGFLLEKPRYDEQKKVWSLRLSPKKNPRYENKSVIITLPASDSRRVAKFYMGDYVKLKNVVLESQVTGQKDLSSQTPESR